MQPQVQRSATVAGFPPLYSVEELADIFDTTTDWIFGHSSPLPAASTVAKKGIEVDGKIGRSIARRQYPEAETVPSRRKPPVREARLLGHSPTSSNSPSLKGAESQPFNILAKLGAIAHLMSVAEVASRLGCSEEKIYRMAASHKIPNVLIGGARCFDPSTLIVWLVKKEPQLAVAARHFGLMI